MELTWLMRIRIALAMAVGIILLGLFGYRFVAPTDPVGPVTVFYGTISHVDKIILIILGFLSGLIAFFPAYPYGSRIAPLAAPAGLCVLAFRGKMAIVLLRNPEISQKMALYSVLKYEGILWLLVILAGYLGVWVADKASKIQAPVVIAESYLEKNSKNYMNMAISLIVSIASALLVIGILAQDVKMKDSALGSVVGQPGVPQIGFSVIAGFAVAAFLSKKYFHISFIVPVIASALLVYISLGILASNQETLKYLNDNWPTTFFPRAINAIMPLQMVSFAGIGAVIGYWIAIKSEYHKKHG